jgi:hypothetical protein
MIWKEWIVTVLEITAVVSVIFAMVILAEMIRTIVKRWERKIPKSLRRNKKMSNKREVPLVLLWVGFAGFVIHTGLNNSAVLENIEAYTTLIAILGGPALLIIKDALDVWKQEQAEKTAFYKVKAQSVIDYNASVLQQAQSIETNEQVHEHKKK